MTDKKPYEEYSSVMTDLLSCVRRLRLTEDALTRAASRRDPGEIDGIVSRAQPDVLTFRGLDRKRMQLENALGFGGKRLEEICALLPADAADLAPVLTELGLELRRYISSREDADRIMKIRLNDVNRILEETGIQPRDPFRGTLA